jgi:transcriptional regulator with XRE-family HTH domain
VVTRASQTPTIGPRLRKLREERGLGLRETARRAGISHGLLSQVETERTNPSVATLARVASVLGVPIFDDLYSQPAPAGRSERVVRRDARRALEAYSPARDWLVTPSTDGTFSAFFTVLAPGSESGGSYAHLGGQEFLYVLAGTLEFGVEGELWELCEGDAITLQASETHEWRNRGPEPVHALWVVENPRRSAHSTVPDEGHR